MWVTAKYGAPAPRALRVFDELPYDPVRDFVLHKLEGWNTEYAIQSLDH